MQQQSLLSRTSPTIMIDGKQAGLSRQTQSGGASHRATIHTNQWCHFWGPQLRGAVPMVTHWFYPRANPKEINGEKIYRKPVGFRSGLW